MRSSRKASSFTRRSRARWTAAGRWLALSLAAVVELALVTGALGAQTPLDRDCLRDLVDSLPPDSVGATWIARHPAVVFLRLAPLRAENQWPAVADSLSAAFRATAPAMRYRESTPFLAELDSMRQEFIAAEGDPSVRLRGRATQRRFNLQREEGRYYLFADQADSIAVRDTMPREVRRAFCWTAMAATDALTAFTDTSRQLLVRDLEARVARWDSFHENGYSMLPLELLVNSWIDLGRPDLEPPRMQLIVLHPSAAVEVVGPRFRDLTRLDVMAVEALGLLRYSSDRESFNGVSAVATFSRSAPTGLGALLHVARLGTVGYVFRRRDADRRRRDGFVMSIDIYGYVTGVPALWRAGREKARELLRRCAEGRSVAVCKP